MALHSGVSGAGAVCKAPQASTSKSLRRRRGSLVRCRAYVWSKDDLARLDALACRPREASLHAPLLNEDERDAVHQEFSVLFCRQFRTTDDTHKRRLRRVANSEGSLLAQHQDTQTRERQQQPPRVREPAAPPEDPIPKKHHQQSPTQQQPHAVTGIAATLIDLTL